MIAGLAWVIGCYGIGILLVHLRYGLLRKKTGSGRPVHRHYIIVTRNNQLQIEWTVRSLRILHWFEGNDVRITCVDQGSGDDTLMILQRFARLGACDLATMDTLSQWGVDLDAPDREPEAAGESLEAEREAAAGSVGSAERKAYTVIRLDAVNELGQVSYSG